MSGIPILNKGAIWTYWQGAYRDTGRDEGATMVLQTDNRNGWFWYIPQHDDIVSVGIVAPFDYLFKGRGANHEKTYHEEVERCPAVKQRIAGATRVTGYFVTRDYSYRSTRVAGDGWVLVGDAFGFLDPLYSSGVLLALKSGELAADAIVEGLSRDDVSEAQLGRWGQAFNEGVDRMRRLVCEYYDGFSFGEFVRKYPHLRNTVTDLLIGDLFNTRVDAVWGPMESLYKPGKTAHSAVERRHPGSARRREDAAPGTAGRAPPVSAMATGFRYSRRVQFSETDLAGHRALQRVFPVHGGSRARAVAGRRPQHRRRREDRRLAAGRGRVRLQAPASIRGRVRGDRLHRGTDAPIDPVRVHHHVG